MVWAPNLIALANAHEAAGGDRSAYVAGWLACENDEKLSKSRFSHVTSFRRGYLDCEHWLQLAR